MAALSLLINNTNTIKAFYDAGYHSISAISQKPKSAFVTDTKGKLGNAVDSEKLHDKACVQQKLIDNYLVYGKATQDAVTNTMNSYEYVDTALGAQVYLHALLKFVTSRLKVKGNLCDERSWESFSVKIFPCLKNPGKNQKQQSY